MGLFDLTIICVTLAIAKGRQKYSTHPLAAVLVPVRARCRGAGNFINSFDSFEVSQ